MKKLAALMMIPALVLLAASTASAYYYDWWGIHGTYAMTGAGNCLWSPSGFDAQLNTNAPPAPVFGSHFAARGNWEFEWNGKGHTTFTQFGIVPPAETLPPGVKANAASLEFSFDFTYTVTHDGVITVEMLPGTFQGKFLTGPNANLTPEKTFTIDKATFVGSISSDHRTLTLTTENELQTMRQYVTGNPNPVSTCPTICNGSRVLIKAQEAYRPTGLR